MSDEPMDTSFTFKTTRTEEVSPLTARISTLTAALEAAQRERDEAKAKARGLFEENATLAGECVLLARAPEALRRELAEAKAEMERLRNEYESRVLWIEKMSKILGYDNSDGFHSEPDPFDLAIRLVENSQSLTQRLKAWKGLALFFRTRAAQVHDELEYMRNWVTPSVGIVRQCADNLKEPIAHFDRLNAEEKEP